MMVIFHHILFTRKEKTGMVKTQVQIPEKLYQEAKRVSREREISLAEVIRRGLEYITRVYPKSEVQAEEWSPPAPRKLGKFKRPVKDWRLMANSPESDLEP